ncbi:MAG: YggS family pyridoxal phosphate-dependent enzyme [Caldicoprobacterales bacterium]
MELKLNLVRIREMIQRALYVAGRNQDDVTLIGVTKTIDVSTIKHAVNLGLTDLGENRVQELVTKYNSLKHENLRWHMIGRLQRNKVKYIVDKVSLIHSLDRLSLAKEINKEASKINREIPVLIQVNPANEKTKNGLPIEEVAPFIETIYNLKYIKVKGLMLIAPLTNDPETIRPYFRITSQLFNSIKEYNYPHVDMKYLSMGMTNDFVTAIEEGSNMVRIGTGIFGKRE